MAIPGALRDLLVTYKIATWDTGVRVRLDARDAVHPFGRPSTREAGWRAASLEPVGLHECRHAAASMMIAAGVNPKALSEYLGHAGIQVTYDRYGRLMPGNESEAAALLDAYLVCADTDTRIRQLDGDGG